MKPLFGIETEYAAAATTQEGGRYPQESLVAEFMNSAQALLPHLPAPEGGIFLGNGARLYIDSGCHPEYATPECTDPLEAVSHVLAGERIMFDIAADVAERVREITRVDLFKNNVDYSGSETTWGCHESYLYRASPANVPGHLIPHLVSRTIYTGAGGFNTLDRGLEFMLSPRAPHIETVCSHDSTRNRGIYHTKNESLSRSGCHRLHLLCGESLCSERALYLKVGATALVVSLVDAGKWPGNSVRLEDPLAALRAVASDCTGTTRVAAVDGRRLSAIDIQFHYLETVEENLDSPFMPRWAEDVCREWRSTLEQLRDDFRSLDTVLDWSIKLALYGERMLRAAVSQSDSAGASRADSAAASRAEGAGASIGGGGSSTLPATRMSGFDATAGDLRRELFEVDTRFAQIGPRGIFTALDTGLLDHRIAAADMIAEAMSTPPPGSRARLRGSIVGRLSGRAGEAHCRWDRILDAKRSRVLDLGDPFETEERWKGKSEWRSSFAEELFGLLI